jgi:hypothetical protein
MVMGGGVACTLSQELLYHGSFWQFFILFWQVDGVIVNGTFSIDFMNKITILLNDTCHVGRCSG